MDIAKFTKTDAEEIVHLFYDTVHTINAKDYTKEQLNAWAPPAEMCSKIEQWAGSLSENIIYISKINNNIVGFSDLATDGLLDRLYVHKKFQRKGIASALIQQLEFDAQKLHISEIQTYAYGKTFF